MKEAVKDENDVKMKDEGEEEEEEKSDEEGDDTRDAMDEPLVSGSLAATLQFLKQKGTSSMPFDAYPTESFFYCSNIHNVQFYFTSPRYVGRANDKRVAAKDDPAPNISKPYCFFPRSL